MTPREATKLRVNLTLAYHDYNRMLNAHAFLKLQSHEQGEDLVQKTFVKTWRYLVKEGKVHQMKAFLFHILNHLIIDEYRKPKMISLDLLLEKGSEPSIDDTKKLINLIDGKAALLLIQQLPLKYKTVLTMHYLGDLSVKEITTINKELENTVVVKLQRGLKKLRLLHKSP